MNSMLNGRRMNNKQLKAISEAHNQSYYQTKILSLLMNNLSDIRNDRINVLNLQHRTIDLESYYISGNAVLEVINEVRFNPNKNTILFYITKNYCLGTVGPIYEISKDSDIKDCISKQIIKNAKITEDLLSVSEIVRHIFVHNYTEMLVIRNHDLKKTIKKVSSKNDNIELLYDAKNTSLKLTKMNSNTI